MPLIGTRKFPKGPSLKRLETHTFNLSGTKITFRAPAHNHDSTPATPPLKEVFNLYDTSLFGRYNKTNTAEPATFGLELKYWRFRGIPVLDGTGVLGDITFSVSVEHMHEFSSVFRPKKLECAIERFIYASYVSYRVSGECRKNWKVIGINNSKWINYESLGYPGFRNAEECYESVWHTPITDEHILTVRFDEVIRKTRTRLAETYQRVIDVVMKSFGIQLSQDAQAQKAAVEAQFPDEKLAESLPAYEFEEFELSNEYELLTEVGARYDFELPYEEVKKLWEEEIVKEKRILKETRARVIASHLRFKDAE